MVDHSTGPGSDRNNLTCHCEDPQTLEFKSVINVSVIRNRGRDMAVY